MHLNFNSTCVCGAALLIIAPMALAGPIREATRTADQLPHVVERAFGQAQGNNLPKKIEEIRFEGLPILYEAEYETADGKEWDIVVRPDGSIVPNHIDRIDDEDDDTGDRNEVFTDEASFHAIGFDALPRTVAESLQKALGKRTATAAHEIRYETLVVLYEFELAAGADVEDDDDDADATNHSHHRLRPHLYLYPSGATAVRRGDLVERRLGMNELPASIGTAVRDWLGAAALEELEEVRYEGIPILYEAEMTVDGEERELVLLANGTVVEENGDDDEDGNEDGIVEREVAPDALPGPIAAALSALLGKNLKEADEIYYDGILVLYEAENDEFDASVYPDGSFAGAERDHDENDAPGDDDDAEDDENDDD